MNLQKKEQKNKTYNNYNTNDLRAYWCEQYYKKHLTGYFPHGYGGYENALLKTLFDLADIFTILLSIDNAIKQNARDIRFFVQNFYEYSPKFLEFSKIQFFVEHFGKKEQKEKWFNLVLCLTSWFPSGEIMGQKEKYKKELEEWIKEEYGE